MPPWLAESLGRMDPFPCGLLEETVLGWQRFCHRATGIALVPFRIFGELLYKKKPKYFEEDEITLSNGSGEVADYQFSGRHNGLYLRFGRIFRPVWLMPLVKDVSKPQQPLLTSVFYCFGPVECSQRIRQRQHPSERPTQLPVQ